VSLFAITVKLQFRMRWQTDSCHETKKQWRRDSDKF